MTEKSTAQSFAGNVSALLAIATFAWGIYTYKQTSAAQLEKDKADAIRTSETRRIEATRPFLDKQLSLYTHVTEIAGRIATNDETFQAAKGEFRRLYYGEMGLVEQAEVEVAMVQLNAAINAQASQEDLGVLALKLAHACRKELAASWGTNAWLRDQELQRPQPKP